MLLAADDGVHRTRLVSKVHDSSEIPSRALDRLDLEPEFVSVLPGTGDMEFLRAVAASDDDTAALVADTTFSSPTVCWDGTDALDEPKTRRIAVSGLWHERRTKHVDPALTLRGLAGAQVRVGRWVRVLLLIALLPRA